MTGIIIIINIYLSEILCGGGKRNRGCALLMTANKPETALYRAPTFSLLLASHGRLNYIFCGTGERNRGCALLMTANKPETALYRAPTFLFSLHMW